MTHPLAETIRGKYETLNSVMDERARRLGAAAEAKAIRRGGIARVTETTGLTHTTIRLGLVESQALPGTGAYESSPRRIRLPGGGRKSLVDQDPTLFGVLQALIEPITRGDPRATLRWTCKSAAELVARGHVVSPRTVSTPLKRPGDSLQSPRKGQGGRYPDRDAQVEHINAQARSLQGVEQPVVPAGAKKEGLVGDYKNGGRGGSPRATPRGEGPRLPRPQGGQSEPDGFLSRAS